MSSTDTFKDQHDQVHNKGNLGHDALVGAATWGAIELWEKHLEKQGKPVNHGAALALFGGFAAAAVTHLGETKGRDMWDEHKRKQAEKQVTENIKETVLVEQYGKQ